LFCCGGWTSCLQNARDLQSFYYPLQRRIPFGFLLIRVITLDTTRRQESIVSTVTRHHGNRRLI
jgi:hypothetical protein